MSENNQKLPSLLDLLQKHTPNIPVVRFLIASNVLVFIAMLFNGAGMWHSPNDVQLNWGANFAPATADGQWWRLFTAMFLHFGVIHLLMNMFALWDCGQLVERMYGRGRFLAIYILSGLMGNLLSLVMQGNQTVSGGASGAVFSLYGALITFLWRERAQIDAREFRWLYWAAIIFSVVTIVMGFIITGVDNYAHIGGFLTGIFLSLVIPKPLKIEHYLPSMRKRVLSGILLAVSLLFLVLHIPAPKYRWSEELQVRKGISEFLQNEAIIQRSWQQIVKEGKAGEVTFDDLAGDIESKVTSPYEASFEQLSKLPLNPALPSAKALANLLQYTEQRKEQTRAAAEALRAQAAQVPQLPQVRSFPYVLKKEKQ